MKNRIKILAIPSDKYGVGYYRSLKPHVKLDELYGDEFDVTIDYNPDTENLEFFDNYDIVHFHKGIGHTHEETLKVLAYLKSKNIVSILDIDDHWEVGPYHPAYQENKRLNVASMLIEHIRNSDYITTTTPIFADKILKYNKNVKVIPNAIDVNEKQFIPKETKSEKIRFGFIMGAQHEHDIELLRGLVSKLPDDIVKQIQFVLCGYDLRGTHRVIDPKTGRVVSTKPIAPEESVWFRYEKIVTNDYKIVSDEYKKFLFTFTPNSEYPNVENESYRRCWTKDISKYATHYNDIDVLLAPLKETDFNYVKSQLKVIEAGMFGKAIIAQDFGPYKIDIVNAIEKGGIINPNGNGLLVSSSSNHSDWAKYIIKLVKNPDLLSQLKTNLNKTVKDKYSLDSVTKDRAEFYKSVYQKK